MNKPTARGGGPGAQTRLAAMLEEAIRCHQDGRTAKADRLYRDVLAIDPQNLDAIHLSGVLAAQRHDFPRAIQLIARAASLNPTIAQIQANLGKAYYGAGRIEDAQASFEAAVRLDPRLGEAWNDLGNTQRDLGRLDLAMASFTKAIELAPNAPEPWANRAGILIDRGDLPAAAASVKHALTLNPRFPEALVEGSRLNLANGRPDLALASADQALLSRPGYADALLARSAALAGIGRLAEAAAARASALATDRDLINRLMSKASTAGLHALHAAAMGYYDAVLLLDPRHVQAMGLRAVELLLLKRLAEAGAAAQRALELDPDDRLARFVQAQVALQVCDWDAQEQALTHMRGLVERGDASAALNAFTFMNFDTGPAEQLACARLCSAQVVAIARPAPAVARPKASGRIRLAYLSADFHSHATAWLLAGLIERHDRSRFEVIGISAGLAIQDEMRRRLEFGFDRFIDIRDMSDEAAHAAIGGLGVDLLVDLKGYTLGHRAGLLAMRPAPVQVSYLGYPGTMGADFIDYLIADARLIAPGEERDYSERIVRLPGSYQVNDDRRALAERSPTRAEAGLPDHGFVFCSFNNSYKISRPVFDVWMRLLAQVEDSVLWLLGDNAWAIQRLRAEAIARGVEPARLIFAERAPPAEHLARHRLADLFLDTAPVNAHTTASDALWAGLPLITVRGSAFIGRVAESVLVADGLPELVAEDLAAYETLALTLASDPARLAQLKVKVAANRSKALLFDTDRFRRHIEAAYEIMHARSRGGLEPLAFDVAE